MKDVDGFHTINVGLLLMQLKEMSPPRPRERNLPDSARAYEDYQVAEPRQMCSLPYIANMIRAGWNLWAAC
jgi:hypothetical protein